MNQWVEYSVGLPAGTEPLRLVPFYRDGKIRLACWNLGVWEAPFYEASSLMVDFAARYGTFNCPGEEVHFVDHSVASANATYSWSFPGATPSASTEQNPTVVYNTEGVYDVTLTITDGSLVQSKTKAAYISSTTASSNCISEGFESGSIPTEWIFGHSTGGGDAWTISKA
jgi:PKD repeat protein